MADDKFSPEPMSKMERLRKNVLWLFQGFGLACVILGLALVGIALYAVMFEDTESPIHYAADLMFSGFVIVVLLAATIIPALLSSLKSEAGVLRALGAGLGVVLAMGLISEIAPPT